MILLKSTTAFDRQGTMQVGWSARSGRRNKTRMLEVKNTMASTAPSMCMSSAQATFSVSFEIWPQAIPHLKLQWDQINWIGMACRDAESTLACVAR